MAFSEKAMKNQKVVNEWLRLFNYTLEPLNQKLTYFRVPPGYFEFEYKDLVDAIFKNLEISLNDVTQAHIDASRPNEDGKKYAAAMRKTYDSDPGGATTEFIAFLKVIDDLYLPDAQPGIQNFTRVTQDHILRRVYENFIWLLRK